MKPVFEPSNVHYAVFEKQFDLLILGILDKHSSILSWPKVARTEPSPEYYIRTAIEKAWKIALCFELYGMYGDQDPLPEHIDFINSQKYDPSITNDTALKIFHDHLPDYLKYSKIAAAFDDVSALSIL